jgi:ubiquinone/menaquinone biosynthesis C-methylase UbiE
MGEDRKEAGGVTASGTHARLFDLVSVPYDLFFHSQRRTFRRVFRAHGGRLGLGSGARVLDIGCGTGALATVFAEQGCRMHAVEPSRGMRTRARRRFAGTGIVLRNADALRGLPYPHGSFDLVVSSHVVHGMPPSDRAAFFREALRVSKGLVLFHDFPPRSLRHAWPDVYVLETLERSDYRRFIRTGTAEMQLAFDSVEVVLVDIGSAWYVCRGRRGGSR